MLKNENENEVRIQEAYKIVRSYGDALTRGTDGMARRISWLPCSILKIRMALCICLEDRYKQNGNKLLEKEYNTFETSYLALDQFLMDKDVDRLKNIEAKPKETWTEEEKHYFWEFAKTSIESKAWSEFGAFVNELVGKRTFDDHFLFPFSEGTSKKQPHGEMDGK